MADNAYIEVGGHKVSISDVASKGSNYITLKSGLKMCWGNTAVPITNGPAISLYWGTKSVTLPISFSSGAVVMVSNTLGAGYPYIGSGNGVLTSSNTITVGLTSDSLTSTGVTASYFCIGY